MITDSFSGRHTTGADRAVAEFEQAVAAIAAHRPAAADALDRALAADPHFVAAHALKGLSAIILAREELIPLGQQALARARAALALHRGGTGSERVLVATLADAVDGRLARAAARLDDHLADDPRDFVAAKLCHAFRFMTGDARGMLAATSRVISHWSPGMAGYGFLLGCHAFGLEECGDLRAAESIGHQAVRHESRDAWGLHAVSHVYEMEGAAAEGANWLEASRPVWSGCNNFSFHMAWHLALFHLELGRHDRALAIYDREVRPAPTDDFRDVANATSLLWRLEQEGVDVGGRWEELRLLAHRRKEDTTLVFAALHHLLTLVAVGDIDAARDLVDNIGNRGLAGEDDQAGVAAGVGHAMAISILALSDDRLAPMDPSRLVERLPSIGGSHAQRDVFVRTLALMAADRGDRGSVERILGARRRLKRDDRFAALATRRLGAAERTMLIA
jgi:tetratricopeptide (TPR) repeat protein